MFPVCLRPQAMTSGIETISSVFHIRDSEFKLSTALPFRDNFVDHFCIVVLQMESSGIPGVDANAVRYVQRALYPDLSDSEASAVFSRMIEESVKSWFTQVRIEIRTFFRHCKVGR